jgi:hypothetical protein
VLPNASVVAFGSPTAPRLRIAELALACYTLAMALTSIRLPDDLVRDVDEVAARRRSTRSEVVREAVAEYCAVARGGREIDPVALVERLVTYPGSGQGDLAQRSEFYLRALFRARRRRPR